MPSGRLPHRFLVLVFIAFQYTYLYIYSKVCSASSPNGEFCCSYFSRTLETERDAKTKLKKVFFCFHCNFFVLRHTFIIVHIFMGWCDGGVETFRSTRVSTCSWYKFRAQPQLIHLGYYQILSSAMALTTLKMETNVAEWVCHSARIFCYRFGCRLSHTIDYNWLRKFG